MPTPTYDLLGSVQVTQNNSITTISFTSWNTSYTHLVLIGRTSGRNDPADTAYWWNQGFKTTSGNYNVTRIMLRYNDFGNPGNDWDWTATDGAGGAGYHAGTGATDTFGVSYALMPRANDTISKGAMFDGNQQFLGQTAAGELYSRQSYHIRSTDAAITTIEITPQAQYFARFTRMYLYGLKNS